MISNDSIRTIRGYRPGARLTALMAVALVAGACGGVEPGEEGAVEGGTEIHLAEPLDAESVPFSLPTASKSWRGEIPCERCEIERLTINLHPEGTFRKERVFVGYEFVTGAPEPAGDSIAAFRGRWTLGEEGDRIRLDGAPDGPLHLLSLEGGTLRMLSAGNDSSGPGGNRDLSPLDSVPDMGGQLREEGHFSYFADGALFVSCQSGIQLPVAMESAFPDLQSAYQDWREEGGFSAGSPMPVVLEGSILDRPAMEGDGREAAFVVSGFDRPTAGRTCASQALRTALDGTVWRLAWMDGEAVEPVAMDPAPDEEGAERGVPTLEWQENEARIGGSGGCNRFNGRGILRGNLLVPPGPLASTLRFCEGVMDRESAYLELLGAGGTLRLDEDGTLRLFHGPRQRARFHRGEPGG